MNAIYKTFLKYNADCVGGKIIPKWPQSQPKWFIQRLYVTLAYTDRGNQELIINDPKKSFYGANISFSKKVFEKIGFFNTSLGRMGSKLYISEEADMFERLINAGGKAVYQPQAVVLHVVGEKRSKKSYFRKLYFDVGEHNALLDGAYNGKNIMGVPLFMFYNLFRSFLRFMKSLILRSDEIFFRELLLWNFLGYIKGRIYFYLKSGKVIWGRE